MDVKATLASMTALSYTRRSSGVRTAIAPAADATVVVAAGAGDIWLSILVAAAPTVSLPVLLAVIVLEDERIGLGLVVLALPIALAGEGKRGDIGAASSKSELREDLSRLALRANFLF